MLRRKIGSKKGFTLIELLVVIAIIGMLATVVMINIRTASAKTRDAKRKSDIQAISTALSSYYVTHGQFPPNGNPCCGAQDSSAEWNMSMQFLVNDRYFGSVPHAQVVTPALPYVYYAYNPDYFPFGAIIMTYMEAEKPTNAAYPGTDRPWPYIDGNGVAYENWCSTSSYDTQYCKLVKTQ